MIRPNYTEKALVVYSPIADNNGGYFRINSTVLSNFYKKRAYKYYCLLIMFFTVFVFARCLSFNVEVFCDEMITAIFSDFSQNGFSFPLIYKHFGFFLINTFVAFLAGFTVFAYPVSLLSVLHLYFNVSFMYSGVIDRFYKVGYITSFAFIALFATYIFFTVIFFSEVLNFSVDNRRSNNTKSVLLYVLSFFLYTSASLGILFLLLNVI